MVLGYHVDLHVIVDTILRLGVRTDSKASVEDQTVQSSQIGCQLLCHRVGLMQVFQVNLGKLNTGDISVRFEAILCFRKVLLFLAKEVELVAIVLKQMCADAKAWRILARGEYDLLRFQQTDASTSPRDDVHFASQVRNVGVRVIFVLVPRHICDEVRCGYLQ